jgi:hypothetical protein
MNVQGWIALGIVALAALFFGRKFFRNLARRGQDAGCGCSDGGGCCGKARRKT